MIHHSKAKYNIVKSVREEIDFFEKLLRPSSGVSWESPIAFLIKRTPFASTCGDAGLVAGGGYLLKLKFWYHVQFPEDIVRRTLKHVEDGTSDDFISINVL